MKNVVEEPNMQNPGPRDNRPTLAAEESVPVPDSRIAPVKRPYSREAAAFLEGSMPAWSKDVEPIKLFRVWARNPAMAAALRPLGGFILAGASIDAADREILILRTSARSDAEYEWGIHAIGFAPRVGLEEATIAATRIGDREDPAFSARQRLLIRLTDALVDHSDIDDALWSELAAVWSDDQLMELVLVVGFYHLVSFSVNALRLGAEAWAPGFPQPA